MTTDITELAHGNSLRKKLNRRLNDAYGFQRTSGGKHTTISLSIDECKSIIAAMDERLALVEALEKAQRYTEELREWNAGLAQESCERQQRISELLEGKVGNALLEREKHHAEVVGKLTEIITELESRTVKLPDFRHERFNSDWGEHDAEAYQVALREELTAAGIKVEAE